MNSDIDSIKIGYVSSSVQKASYILSSLLSHYNLIDLNNFDNIESLDLILVLGGDGLILRTIHKYIDYNIPFYGINCGTLGFLLNDYPYGDFNLRNSIKRSYSISISPLNVDILFNEDKVQNSIAVNEVSILRSSPHSAFLKIIVNNTIRVQKLTADGMLVATPTGSTAYNSAVGGVMLPIESNLLSLSPISPFKPRMWAGAVLPIDSLIEIEIINYDYRPVKVTTDYTEYTNPHKITVTKHLSKNATILFDSQESLKERFINQQFNIF